MRLNYGGGTAEYVVDGSEREAIENWFLLGSSITSPKTNEPMTNCQAFLTESRILSLRYYMSEAVAVWCVHVGWWCQVIPNHALKSLILEFREKASQAAAAENSL